MDIHRNNINIDDMDSTFDQYNSVVLVTGNVLDNEEQFRLAKTPCKEIASFVKSRVEELKAETLSKELDFVDPKLFLPAPTTTSEQQEGGIKVIVKIFLNEFHENSIDEIIDTLPKVCVTEPSVILAYHPTSKDESSNKFIWGDDSEEFRKIFKSCWNKLRQAKKDGKITSLGVSDIDLDSIHKIFDDDVDFSVLQINTQTCCVVPPELQNFCKEREIQLLTHSDPQIILPSVCLKEIQMDQFKVKWTVRHLETLVCRGILTRKSFVVKLVKA